MNNTAMKMFFLIAPAIYIVNLAVSFVFKQKYKNDVIYRRNLNVWAFYLIFTFSQAFTTEDSSISIEMKVFSWCLFMFMLQESISLFISTFFTKTVSCKKDVAIFCAGALASFLLLRFNVQFNLSIFPVVFVSAWPVLKQAKYLKDFKGQSFVFNGYLLCSVLTGLHILDFAYAADKPELIFPGYLIALILTTGISCFTYAVLVEKAIMEIEMKDMLHNTARLVALGGMAAEIAHEINNPLTILSMNLELMRNKLVNIGEVEATLTSKLDVAEKMTDRIHKIVAGLKASYRGTSNDHFKLVSLSEILEDTKTLCDIRTKKNGVDFSISFPKDDGLKIECKSTQITQILQNLVNNAVDATKNIEGKKWIRIEFNLLSDSIVEIHVIDSGPGIERELRDKIFENLFTTKSDGNGTGIGLSFARRVAMEHGGYLKLNNSDSEPTAFILGLPLRQNEKASS